MKSRLATFTSILLSAGMATALLVNVAPAAIPADDAAAATTEDIVYMLDGRVLHGQIVSETAAQVVFQYVDRKLNLQTKLTLKTDEIAKIDRDQPLKDAPPSTTPTTDPAAGSSSGSSASGSKPAATTGKKDEKIERTYGASRTESADPNVTSFYIVPMSGQMGTDVHDSIYKKIKDDILLQKPDYIVVKMMCQDDEDRIYSRFGKEEQGFDGSQFLDNYREMVGVFHDELRDIPQVLWVEDSKGISSVIALSWDHIFMMPQARFGGLDAAATNFLRVQNDFNTLGKYREAYMAWLKGFAEYGRQDLHILDAMVRPEYKLSATWKGRDVVWSLDDSGEYLVDGNEEGTVIFRAKSAEDFNISDGTAETLEDLALLLGVREFRVCDGKGEEMFDGYKEDWRRDFTKCGTWLADYQQFLGWANGEDAVKYLGQAKSRLEDVLSAIERYEAVEIRVGMEYGLGKINLTTMIEQLKEQLRALKDGGRGNAGGTGGRGGGGGRAGGGGGGR